MSLNRYAFETMLKKNGEIVSYEKHIKRLKKSLKLLGFECFLDFEMLRLDIEKLPGAVVRLSTNGKNYDLKDRIFDYTKEQYDSGFNFTINKILKKKSDILNDVKSERNEIYKKELAKVRSLSFDECLLVNDKGEVAEGCITNVFFIKDGTVHTPSLSSGLLKGIMRDKVIQFLRETNIEIIEKEILFADCASYDSAFCTNSIMGMMPINKISNINYNTNIYFKEEFDKWILKK